MIVTIMSIMNGSTIMMMIIDGSSSSSGRLPQKAPSPRCAGLHLRAGGGTVTGLDGGGLRKLCFVHLGYTSQAVYKLVPPV
jgi:hypothetical protein